MIFNIASFRWPLVAGSALGRRSRFRCGRPHAADGFPGGCLEKSCGALTATLLGLDSDREHVEVRMESKKTTQCGERGVDLRAGNGPSSCGVVGDFQVRQRLMKRFGQPIIWAGINLFSTQPSR